MPALWGNDQENRSGRTLYLFLSLVPARVIIGCRQKCHWDLPPIQFAVPFAVQFLFVAYARTSLP